MPFFRFRPIAAALLAVGALSVVTLSCGGSDSPSSSTPPVTIAPQPTPTPSAPSGLTDPFNHASCSFGKGDINADCGEGRTQLLDEMEAAMDLLVKEKPQIFDLESEYAPGTRAYIVKDKEAYLNGLIVNLRAAGNCAERDPDDQSLETIRAKNASDFSEEFDVLLSSGHMRRGNGMFRRTCSPSNFPVDRPADAPPIGSGCGRPYPPPVSRFNCKVHLKGTPFTLDATPQVGPDVAYCASIGFTDRAICPLRPEDWSDRKACENWRVGKAKDTGRYGPTWRKADGGFCTGPDSGCENSPNQYQLYAYKPGTYTVTAENGATCSVTY
jgi:hypothetical protein